jgi:NAD(P)-dependent dehydrogenase (short-subunit alcohol dehydrogenase family)
MGIGQAVSFRLAEAGAGVMIADIDAEAASQTIMQIKASGGKARAIRADASSTADAKAVVQATLEAFGCLDILVNNAGIYPISPALETSEEMWDKVLNINLKGAFFYSQAAAQEMVRAGRGGKIINMASIDAMHPYGGVAHYGASKARDSHAHQSPSS